MSTRDTLAARGAEIASLLGDPGLVPFLPLLYVAWADGELEPDELRLIRSKVDAAEGLTPSVRAALGRWLDPEAPPSAQGIQDLLAAIRRGAEGLTASQNRTLTDLGMGLVRTTRQPVQPVVQNALRALEAALGVAGEEATRRILIGERPPSAAAEPQPAFDAEAMSRLLDGDHRALRNEIRSLLSQPVFRVEPGLDRAAYREQVLAWCGELASRGHGAYPQGLGGESNDGRYFATFETLAFGDLSLLVKFGVQFGLFAGSIEQLGTRNHHERYLRQVRSFELLGCFAMTETGHGSNVHDIETSATYDHSRQEFVLRTPLDRARKDYIGNAALDARMATVFAQLQVSGESHGVHAFLVPIRQADGRPAPGVRIEDCGEKMGLNGVDNGRLWFDGVRIPRENLLDRFGQVSPDGAYSSPIPSSSKRFFTMLGTLVGGRMGVGLAALSASKLALTIAVRYASRRRQFGPEGAPEVPILDYLSHQRRLMPRLAATYALDFALKHLVRRYRASRAEDQRELEGIVAGLKAISTWHATNTIQTCREACGGQGYLAVNRFAALKADTDVFTTFEGDNTVLLQLLGKSLVTGHKKQFGEMNLGHLVRYLAARAGTAISELNPVVTRITDEAHLRDRAFLLGALRWRAQHLVGSVARRIKRRIDAGADSFLAVNECQDHLIETARAYVESLVAEQFAEGIDACRDAELRRVLAPLFELYSLWLLESERGWFLEQGYLEGGKAKAIRRLVNKLCGEVRSQAVPLVDAFGVPEACLPPIAA